MTHVITGDCCNDAACVPVCPVNCIHPTPDEPDYRSAEMLYIDPEACIDCGACADACPVRAVVPDFELEAEDEPFLALNAAWYAAAGRNNHAAASVSSGPLTTSREGPLRVAVIGSGPAAAYAVEALLGVRGPNVQVTVLERLLTPGGLIRFGVAPDHQGTKAAWDGFDRTFRRTSVTMRLGVEVGVDVTVDELLESHHAVLFSTGAPEGRSWSVPGHELAGVHSAADFVSWYNGHPDGAHQRFDLRGERAIVVGNGNVALDVARILATDPDAFTRTDIADHALESLRTSRIREVVVVGRRGPEHAAFTAGERSEEHV